MAFARAEREGISLVELAVAWTLEHRAVTASIIGPRSLEQLKGQLRASEIRLSTETLDVIDELVPPGVTLNPADNGYDPVWLGVMIGLNLQTSFLTPPFGATLFYMRGATPPEITTGDIWIASIPWTWLQLGGLIAVWACPGLAPG